MYVGKNINVILIVQSFLIKTSLAGLLMDEYSNIRHYDVVDDFDTIMSLVERNQYSCILADALTIKNLGMYFRKLPDNSIVIPVLESGNDIGNFIDFKNIITTSDDKSRIIEIIQKAISTIPRKVSINPQLDELTGREKIILQLIAQGLSSKLIADKLDISVQTVSTHRKNISSKLGIKSVSGLTVYAILNNLISPEETKQS